MKECTARHIPPDELARVHEARGHFETFTSAEKHLYWQRNVAKNGAVLARDLRFVDYSDGELAKAAYYRGVCEKDQIFRGKSPDFASIDARLADRATLVKLPNVNDLVKIDRNHRQDYGMEL